MFRSFLESLVALKKLKTDPLGHCEDSLEQSPARAGYSYQGFIRRIAPLHNRIEVLDMSIPENTVPHDLKIIRSVRTFSPFLCLRTLSILESALFGNYEIEKVHPCAPKDLYPKTMEF